MTRAAGAVRPRRILLRATSASACLPWEPAHYLDGDDGYNTPDNLEPGPRARSVPLWARAPWFVGPLAGLAFAVSLFFANALPHDELAWCDLGDRPSANQLRAFAHEAWLHRTEALKRAGRQA